MLKKNFLCLTFALICFHPTQLLSMHCGGMSGSSHDLPDSQDPFNQSEKISQTFSSMAALAQEDLNALYQYSFGQFSRATTAASSLNKEGKAWLRSCKQIGKTTKEALDSATNLVSVIYAAQASQSDEIISFKDRNDRDDISHQQTLAKLKAIDRLINSTDTCMQNVPLVLESMKPIIRDIRKMQESKTIPPEQLRAERLATREDLQFKGTQLRSILTNVETATNSFAALATETNKNLETLERIFNLIQQSNNNQFRAKTLEEEQTLHTQRMQEGEQRHQTITWTAFYATNFMQSFERIATSDVYRHNITHTKNTFTRTFASVASISIGGLLLYKHLANHVDHKSTILASIGAGLITVPWIASYIDR